MFSAADLLLKIEERFKSFDLQFLVLNEDFLLFHLGHFGVFQEVLVSCLEVKRVLGGVFVINGFLSDPGLGLFFDDHPEAFVIRADVEGGLLLELVFVHESFHVDFEALLALILARSHELVVMGTCKLEDTV